MVSHWSIPNVQPPLHSQSPYANQNGNADACYVCGDWLVCQTISVCNNPVACTARILARACILRCNSDVHIGSGDGTLNSVDGPRVVFACPLNPHFAHSATHCVE